MDGIVIKTIFVIGVLALGTLTIIAAYLDHVEHPLGNKLGLIVIVICFLGSLGVGIRTIIKQEFTFKTGGVATGGYAIFIGTLLIICSLLMAYMGFVLVKKDKDN